MNLEEEARQLQVMKEVDEHYTVLVIKTFHRKLSTQQARQSLIPTDSLLDASFSERFTPSDNVVRLPKIELPKFNGNILNFGNFKSLFENVVHSKAEIPNVTKLYHLTNSLEGNAKDLLRDFELTDEAYTEAWSYLLTRYDNPKMVIRNALFKRLRSISTTSSYTEARELIDQVDMILRGLRSNGGEINETFSEYIAYHVASCLDKRTREDFNFANTSRKAANFDDLRKFVLNRDFSIDGNTKKDQEKSKGGNPNKVKGKDKKKTTYKGKYGYLKFTGAVAGISCILCTKSHYLDQCEAFIKLDVGARFDMIKEKHLCGENV